MGPRLLGVAVVQLNFWINIYLASGMQEGSATALTIAWQLMTMPQVVIAQAIAIAALPTFSAQAAGGKHDEMRASLAGTLRGVLLLAIPAAIGLILLREPLVAMLFERGEFNQLSTQLVAWALLWYGLGLVSHSVVEIVSRAFYALHDTKTPVFIGAAAMSLNVILSFLFAAWFERLGWFPHGGLALANTTATTLEMIGLLVLMRRRLNGLKGGSIVRGGLAAAVAGLVMAGGLLFILSGFQDWSVWMIGIGGSLSGALLYGIMLVVLRVPEIQSLLKVLRRRIMPEPAPRN
jgi:putative peptidoglycan lipid II flippase